MLRNTRSLASALPLAIAAVLGLGTSCPYEEYAVFQFALSGCPDSTFALVDSAQSGLQSLRLASDPERHPNCPAFKTYDFVAGRLIGGNGVFVALKRGQTCQLVVSMLADTLVSSESVEWAHAVARLSLGAQASALNPTLVGKRRIGAPKVFQVWCREQQEVAAITPTSVPRCT